MLTDVELRNYRGFEQHETSFRDLSVLVGKNNAGKSSLIEALRITSVAIRALRSARFTAPPHWALKAGACRGVSPDSSTVQIDLRTVFFRYNPPPAVINCRFANGTTVTTFLGPDEGVHSCLFDQAGNGVVGNREAKRLGLPSISVLPQIGPLEQTETMLHKAYIQRCLDGHLSSRHFRNQIRFNYKLYEPYCNLVRESWPSIFLDEFISPDAIHGDELALFVREQGFVAEVSSFGHGIQMWLQIVWFLTRTSTDSVVILDEPDVYMHPTLQQKLIDLVKGRFVQCIISTHAAPIIESIDGRNILEVNRRSDRSEYRC